MCTRTPAPSGAARDAARSDAEDSDAGESEPPAEAKPDAADEPDGGTTLDTAKTVTGEPQKDKEPDALSSNTAAAARAAEQPAPLAEGVNVPDSVDPQRKPLTRERPPVPDDPGVDPDAPKEESVPRFRLF